jgi:hypothetical protein
MICVAYEADATGRRGNNTPVRERCAGGDAGSTGPRPGSRFKGSKGIANVVRV